MVIARRHNYTKKTLKLGRSIRLLNVIDDFKWEGLSRIASTLKVLQKWGVPRDLPSLGSAATVI
jgi:hypothetical protein